MLFDIYNYSNELIGQVEANDIVGAWSKAGKKYEDILDIRPKGLTDYLVESVEPKKFYKVGDRMEHWRFGLGIITGYRYSVNRWLVDIRFDNPEYGTKIFLAEVPYLSKEDIVKLTLA